MEEDKSALEILKEFADKSNREIKHFRKDYPIDRIRPRFLYKSFAIIKDEPSSSVYFVNYSDSKAFGDSAFFSGLFFPITASESTNIYIRKKTILDKVNPFANKESYRTRFSDFNSKVIITENDINYTNKILNNNKAQTLIVEALNLDERIRIGVNNLKIDIIQDINENYKLETGSYFEIYIIGQWLLDDSTIEELFKIANELKEVITNI